MPQISFPVDHNTTIEPRSNSYSADGVELEHTSENSGISFYKSLLLEQPQGLPAGKLNVTKIEGITAGDHTATNEESKTLRNTSSLEDIRRAALSQKGVDILAGFRI